MKKIGVLALLMVAAISSWAQTITVNDANAQPRKVGDFNGVKVSMGIQLLIQQGDQDAVAVSCNRAEYTDRIKTVVEGGVLKIYIEPLSGDWSWRKNITFKAYVSIKELTKLTATSGAVVKTGSAVKVNQLTIDCNSGAIVEAEFSGSSISVDNSSGAITTLKGSVDNLTVGASSGAIFKGYELSSVNCNADASSGGMIHTTVTKELNAEATSGGSIDYKGGGVIRKLHTGSGGSVKSNS